MSGTVCFLSKLPLNTECRADEERARMRAENPVRSHCGHAGGRPRSLDRWLQWRQRKEVSPRYVLEVKPVGPASGWDVGVREREESGCLHHLGAGGAVGSPGTGFPPLSSPADRSAKIGPILQIQRVGVTVKRPRLPCATSPCPGWAGQSWCEAHEDNLCLGVEEGSVGPGEALPWKAVVTVPTQTLFQAPLSPKVGLVLSRKTFLKVRKGLTEDTGHEQPSVHPALCCPSVSLTYSFVK